MYENKICSLNYYECVCIDLGGYVVVAEKIYDIVVPDLSDFKVSSLQQSMYVHSIP